MKLATLNKKYFLGCLFGIFTILGCSSDDTQLNQNQDDVFFAIESLRPTQKQFNTSEKTANARGLQLINDTLMIVFSRGTNKAESYILSVEGEIETATHFTSFSTSNYIGSTAQGENGHGIFIDPAELSKMWIYNRTEIWQFNLSVPGELSSAQNSGYYDFSNQVERGHGIFFNANGTSLYIDDRNKAVIHQFELTNPWDISEFEAYQFLDISEQHEAIRATVFKPNGSLMFTLDTGLQEIKSYQLEENWNVSSAVLSHSKSIDLSNPRGFTWNSDGSKAYIMNTDTGMIHQYKVGE